MADRPGHPWPARRVLGRAGWRASRTRWRPRPRTERGRDVAWHSHQGYVAAGRYARRRAILPSSRWPVSRERLTIGHDGERDRIAGIDAVGSVVRFVVGGSAPGLSGAHVQRIGAWL